MRLEQIPKFFREKNENLKDSIILRKTRASDESRKESDVSSSLKYIIIEIIENGYSK